METLTNTSVSGKALDEIIEKYRGKPGMLLSALEEIQEKNELKFLPGETLAEISSKLNIPYTQVYSVATFYSYFNLKPQGKHSVVVCRGTACHTKGSKALLDDVAAILGFRRDVDGADSKYTTPDNMFTVKTVACFGQCAQSPVVEVDGAIYSNVNSQKLLKILKRVKREKLTNTGKPYETV
ncbi:MULTISPECIES: complex I 24 kDa subunit family protein [Proteiniphilum]|jgi:NADH-quinone oxidoreductase subunit E|uniref:NADH-quinone oxidoreductase subunit NuoE family protein n=1 Tax=Proteiniphilum TaxID=294702 RepID=UPI001EEC7A08|nr:MULTISPECIES: NAD(P)H-dependent oxidoreductase subunit E [Proteiniphilum]ULB34871.1 NAD(P)H-dependent oxidoreductase subunit E [Proteiniphilum propionicum]